jgi:hypothetical protein
VAVGVGDLAGFSQPSSRASRWGCSIRIVHLRLACSSCCAERCRERSSRPDSSRITRFQLGFTVSGSDKRQYADRPGRVAVPVARIVREQRPRGQRWPRAGSSCLGVVTGHGRHCEVRAGRESSLGCGRVRSVYWLSVFMPIALALKLAHASPSFVFVCSALAVVPPAAQMSNPTEQLSARSGPGVAGLLNVTFGNAAEFDHRVLRVARRSAGGRQGIAGRFRDR